MATDTQTRERQDLNTERLAQLLPPYRVLLHNDDDNSMDHVVTALLESVPKLTARDATRVMLEAHLRGVALVIVCPREQAEFYCERLVAYGLVATMERQ